MFRRPPGVSRTDTLFPYTTLFRSCVAMILVTCANGRLGTAIIKALLKDEDCPPLRIAARDITKINKSLAARCTLLKVDYDDPPSMKAAFNRVTTLMFISSTAANPERIRQHQAVRSEERRVGNECVSKC